MIAEHQEFNPYEIMRALADGSLRDPVGDCAVEIVTELEKEICAHETSWSDVELSNIVEEIIRRHFRDLPKATIEKGQP